MFNSMFTSIFHSIKHVLPACCLLIYPSLHAETWLSNASYTATKEMFVEYNQVFARHWKGKTGEQIEFRQSHANSSTQASLVNNGFEADVVTLSIGQDIDDIAVRGNLAANWKERLPNDATPYQSTIVFLVRKGNPKNIRDWSDLVRWGIRVVMSNPKTSGGARWSHLAAWGYALKKYGGNEANARQYLKRLYANNKLLEYTARGASNTFIDLQQGDVMVSWENEAFQLIAKYPGKFDLITPSMSIIAEPPVAIVDRIVDQRGTRKLAEAYLQYLYSPEGQEIAVKHFYRPTNPEIANKYAEKFGQLKLFRLSDLYKDWKTAYRIHFQDGGIFDQVYDQYRNAS